MASKEALQKGREKCPKCSRKGLGYAQQPHVISYRCRVIDKATCRYCKASFRIKESK